MSENAFQLLLVKLCVVSQLDFHSEKNWDEVSSENQDELLSNHNLSEIEEVEV